MKSSASARWLSVRLADENCTRTFVPGRGNLLVSLNSSKFLRRSASASDIEIPQPEGPGQFTMEADHGTGCRRLLCAVSEVG